MELGPNIPNNGAEFIFDISNLNRLRHCFFSRHLLKAVLACRASSVFCEA